MSTNHDSCLQLGMLTISSREILAKIPFFMVNNLRTQKKPRKKKIIKIICLKKQKML